jgi:hypothetical protein
VTFDVEYKLNSEPATWRRVEASLRYPSEVGRAVETILSTKDWLRIVITKSKPEPKHAAKSSHD